MVMSYRSVSNPFASLYMIDASKEIDPHSRSIATEFQKNTTKAYLFSVCGGTLLYTIYSVNTKLTFKQISTGMWI